MATERKYSNIPIEGCDIVGVFDSAQAGIYPGMFLGFGRLGQTSWQGHFWRVKQGERIVDVLIPVKEGSPAVGSAYMLTVSLNKKGQAACIVGDVYTKSVVQQPVPAGGELPF